MFLLKMFNGVLEQLKNKRAVQRLLEIIRGYILPAALLLHLSRAKPVYAETKQSGLCSNVVRVELRDLPTSCIFRGLRCLSLRPTRDY